MMEPRHPDLSDARDALDYWERRGRALPRRSRRDRREAAEMTARARRRVTDAERAAYGQGALGALTQLATEGRLPQPVRDTGRRVAHTGRRTVVALVVLTALCSLLVLLAVVAVVLALLGVL